ncbi:hypothetical protein FF2_016750 [Malus domestica]
MRSLDLHREIGAEEIRRRWSIEEPPGIAERVKAIRRHHRRNLDDPSPIKIFPIQDPLFLSPMAPRKLVEDPPAALVENFDDKDHCDSIYF